MEAEVFGSMPGVEPLRGSGPLLRRAEPLQDHRRNSIRELRHERFDDRGLV